MFTILLPGSFNPPTLGHLKLIEHASLLCTKLYVGIGQNLEKVSRLLTIEKTIELLTNETAHLGNVTVRAFTSLSVEFAKEIQAHCIIRGVRGPSDVSREMQMAEINYQLSGIQTLFLPAHPETKEISSTLIRELAYHHAPLSKFLPKSVADAITRRNK